MLPHSARPAHAAAEALDQRPAALPLLNERGCRGRRAVDAVAVHCPVGATPQVHRSRHTLHRTCICRLGPEEECKAEFQPLLLHYRHALPNMLQPTCDSLYHLQAAPEEECKAEFQPVVQLEEVEVATGEEDEAALFDA